MAVTEHQLGIQQPQFDKGAFRIPLSHASVVLENYDTCACMSAGETRR